MKRNKGGSLFARFVYEHSQKPEHYVRVEHPITLQEHRQVQYNNWCKKYGVYNGSYLPEAPDVLKRKGWIETTSLKNNSGKSREFQRKSNGQMVRFDPDEYKKGRWEDKHYHWENAYSIEGRRKLKKANRYIDRYGKVCADQSRESHLAPEDRKYRFKK